MRGDTIKAIMPRERVLLTEEESEEHNRRLGNILSKSKIAAGATTAFAAASIAFPIVLPGAFVAAGETARQTIKMSSEAVKFHRKYRRVDKK